MITYFNVKSMKMLYVNFEHWNGCVTPAQDDM